MPDIEDLINKAIQDGKFDDLQGKGKPLRLDENPHTDPEWRLAHHMIKSSGYTLPWIGRRQEILEALESARTSLGRTWSWREAALSSAQPGRGLTPAQVESEWRRALAEFTNQIESLNKKIFNYNLEVPSDRFQLSPLNLEREINSITKAG